VLVLLGLHGDALTGMSVEIERNFAKQGVSSVAMSMFIRDRVPEFPAYFQEATNRFITASLIRDRYHKMYYDNKAPAHMRGRRGKEHYLFHKKLRGLVPVVDAVYLQGGPITLETILTLIRKADGK
jgi:hypothetical protein